MTLTDQLDAVRGTRECPRCNALGSISYRSDSFGETLWRPCAECNGTGRIPESDEQTLARLVQDAKRHRAELRRALNNAWGMGWFEGVRSRGEMMNCEERREDVDAALLEYDAAMKGAE